LPLESHGVTCGPLSTLRIQSIGFKKKVRQSHRSHATTVTRSNPPASRAARCHRPLATRAVAAPASCAARCASALLQHSRASRHRHRLSPRPHQVSGDFPPRATRPLGASAPPARPRSRPGTGPNALHPRGFVCFGCLTCLPLPYPSLIPLAQESYRGKQLHDLLYKSRAKQIQDFNHGG